MCTGGAGKRSRRWARPCWPGCPARRTSWPAWSGPSSTPLSRSARAHSSVRLRDTVNRLLGDAQSFSDRSAPRLLAISGSGLLFAQNVSEYHPGFVEAKLFAGLHGFHAAGAPRTPKPQATLGSNPEVHSLQLLPCRDDSPRRSAPGRIPNSQVLAAVVPHVESHCLRLTVVAFELTSEHPRLKPPGIGGDDHTHRCQGDAEARVVIRRDDRGAGGDSP